MPKSEYNVPHKRFDIFMVAESVTITMYRWAGTKYGITIKSECKECDINAAILQDMKDKEFAGKKVVIEIKPWLTHVWESLRRGGWHAPVIVVEKRIFSQGVVLKRKELAQRVLQILYEKEN